jgi:hypothetical protein
VSSSSKSVSSSVKISGTSIESIEF